MSNEDRKFEIIDKIISLSLEYEAITGRYMNITGEVGEVLACKYLNLTINDNPIEEGFDAYDCDQKVQIKTRRQGKNENNQIVNFKSSSFHYALLVLLKRDYSLDKIYKLEVREIKAHVDSINLKRESECKDPKYTIPKTTFIKLCNKKHCWPVSEE